MIRVGLRGNSLSTKKGRKFGWKTEEVVTSSTYEVVACMKQLHRGGGNK